MRGRVLFTPGGPRGVNSRAPQHGLCDPPGRYREALSRTMHFPGEEERQREREIDVGPHMHRLGT